MTTRPATRSKPPVASVEAPTIHTVQALTKLEANPVATEEATTTLIVVVILLARSPEATGEATTTLTAVAILPARSPEATEEAPMTPTAPATPALAIPQEGMEEVTTILTVPATLKAIVVTALPENC